MDIVVTVHCTYTEIIAERKTRSKVDIHPTMLISNPRMQPRSMHGSNWLIARASMIFAHICLCNNKTHID